VRTFLGMTTATGSERVLRPVRHLRWRSTMAGNIALFAPGASVAIVLAVIDGRAPIAAALFVLLLAAAAIVIVPALGIRLRLDDEGVTTFWIRLRRSISIPRDAVARAVVRTVYNGDGISTNRHLFLLDEADRPVHRMSTRWWTDEQLLTVAHHFHVPLDSQPQPVQLAEVRRTAAHHLGWSERHRVTAKAVLIVGGFALCLAFAWLTSAAI